MKYEDPLDMNDRAQQLWDRNEFAQALALFQQVFLSFGRSEHNFVRVQVARALYFAARCNRALGRDEMASQIDETLWKRFENDDNLRARYWAELARSGLDPTDEHEEEPPAPSAGLDAFLADLLKTTKTTSPAAVNSVSPAADETSASPFQPPIDGKELTLSRLSEIFEAARIGCVVSGSELKLEVGDTTIYVSRHRMEPLLYFHCSRRFQNDTAEVERALLANRINRTCLLIRAAATEQHVIFDYSLSIEGSVLPNQLVQTARLFSTQMKHALDECDKDKLVI